MSEMHISRLARRTGVPASTLRYYEERGLLPARRSPAGYRVYDGTAVERLKLITGAKRLGLPLEEIAGLLGVWESGTCAQVKSALLPRIRARVTAAEDRGAELASFSAAAREVLRRVEDLPDRDRPCGPECGGAAVWQEPAEAEGGPGEAVPLVCSLPPEDGADRLAQWREALHGAHREEAGNEARLSVPAARAASLAELAAAEQRCCPFFGFTLEFAGDTLHLRVRVPGHARGLLAGFLEQTARTP